MIQRIEHIFIRLDKLVEGVADISCKDVGDAGSLIGDLHRFCIHIEREVCLVVISVICHVHFVTGVDIERAVCFIHPQAACVERNRCVARRQICMPERVEVLVIFRYGKDRKRVVLIRICLTCDNIVVGLACIESAEDGQLQRNDDVLFHRDCITELVVFCIGVGRTVRSNADKRAIRFGIQIVCVNGCPPSAVSAVRAEGIACIGTASERVDIGVKCGRCVQRRHLYIL